MIKWRDIELPGFDRPLRAVGKKRRKIFAALLEELIANVSRPRTRTVEPMKARPEATAFADACRVCRGHCCSKGGNDAYLDENAIRLAWARHPRLSARGLMQLYLDAIPKKAFADSCLFHAKNGCSLPRSLRAPVSEAYLCGPLMRLMKG
jgi:hypothetical protein